MNEQKEALQEMLEYLYGKHNRDTKCQPILDDIIKSEQKLAEEIKNNSNVGYFLKNIRKEDDKIEASWVIRGIPDSDGIATFVIEEYAFANTEATARLEAWYRVYQRWQKQKE